MHMIDIKRIKSIGFDVDGTLYRVPEPMSIDVSKEVIAIAAKELGRSDDDFAEEYVARREEYRSNTMTLNSFGLDGERIFQAVFDRTPLERYVKKDERLIAMLVALKKKYRLFIISNGSGVQIGRKLVALGVNAKWFDPIVSCYEKGWVKPEPAPFLTAIESLNLKPEEIVYVGDRTDVDMDAAKAVGMKTIFVGGSYFGADASCETVYDVEQLL